MEPDELDELELARARVLARQRRRQNPAAARTTPTADQFPSDRPRITGTGPRGDVQLADILQPRGTQVFRGDTQVTMRDTRQPTLMQLLGELPEDGVGELVELPPVVIEAPAPGVTGLSALQRRLAAGETIAEIARQPRAATEADYDAARRRARQAIHAAEEAGDTVAADRARVDLDALSQAANRMARFEEIPYERFKQRLRANFALSNRNAQPIAELQALRERDPEFTGVGDETVAARRRENIGTFTTDMLADALAVAGASTALGVGRGLAGVGRRAVSEAMWPKLDAAADLTRRFRAGAMPLADDVARRTVPVLTDEQLAARGVAERIRRNVPGMAGVARNAETRMLAQRGATEGLLQGTIADAIEAETYYGTEALPQTVALSLALQAGAGAGIEVLGTRAARGGRELFLDGRDYIADLRRRISGSPEPRAEVPPPLDIATAAPVGDALAARTAARAVDPRLVDRPALEEGRRFGLIDRLGRELGDLREQRLDALYNEPTTPTNRAAAALREDVARARNVEMETEAEQMFDQRNAPTTGRRMALEALKRRAGSGAAVFVTSGSLATAGAAMGDEDDAALGAALPFIARRAVRDIGPPPKVRDAWTRKLVRGVPEARRIAEARIGSGAMLPWVTRRDEAFARQVADWYERTPSAPDDPEVQAAYRAFADETRQQYEDLVARGVRFEFVDENPYATSADMMRDVAENNRLKVLKSESTFGERAHPLLSNEENDMFRAVHDYFGHAAYGNRFGAIGEENAYRIHSAMYSPEARRAMATETRGQNSWVNEQPVNRERPGTVYAEQKVMLMPEELLGPYPGETVRPAGRASTRTNVEMSSESSERLTNKELGKLTDIERRLGRAAFIREVVKPIIRSERLPVELADGLGSWFEEGFTAANEAALLSFRNLPPRTIQRVIARISQAAKHKGTFFAIPDRNGPQVSLTLDIGRRISEREYKEFISRLSQLDGGARFAGSTMHRLSPGRLQIVLNEGMDETDAVQLETLARRAFPQYPDMRGEFERVTAIYGGGPELATAIIRYAEDVRALSPEQALAQQEAIDAYDSLDRASRPVRAARGALAAAANAFDRSRLGRLTERLAPPGSAAREVGPAALMAGTAGAAAAAAEDEQPGALTLAGPTLLAAAGAGKMTKAALRRAGGGASGAVTTRLTLAIERLPKSWDEPRPLADWVELVRRLPDVSRAEGEALIARLSASADDPKPKYTADEVLFYLRNAGVQQRFDNTVRRGDIPRNRYGDRAWDESAIEEAAYQSAREQRADWEADRDVRIDEAEAEWDNIPDADFERLFDALANEKVSVGLVYQSDFTDPARWRDELDMDELRSELAQAIRYDGLEDIRAFLTEYTTPPGGGTWHDPQNQRIANRIVAQMRGTRLDRWIRDVNDAVNDTFDFDSAYESEVEFYRDEYGPSNAYNDNAPEYAQYQRVDEDADYRESLVKLEGLRSNAPHFPDDNPLAWARTEDTLASVSDGNRYTSEDVRLIIETQSDYMQRGQQEGFRRPLPPERRPTPEQRDAAVAEHERLRLELNDLYAKLGNADGAALNARISVQSSPWFTEMHRAFRNNGPNEFAEVVRGVTSRAAEALGAGDNPYMKAAVDALDALMHQHISDAPNTYEISGRLNGKPESARYDSAAEAIDAVFRQHFGGLGFPDFDAETAVNRFMYEMVKAADTEVLKSMRRAGIEDISELPVSDEVRYGIVRSIGRARQAADMDGMMRELGPLGERMREAAEDAVARLQRYVSGLREQALADAQPGGVLDILRDANTTVANLDAQRAALAEAVNAAADRRELLTTGMENPRSHYDASEYVSTLDTTLAVMGNEILHAINDGIDVIALDTPSSRMQRANLSAGAAEVQYGINNPKAVNAIHKALGIEPVWVEASIGGEPRRAFRITPELKAAVARYGVPILGAVGMLAVGSEEAQAQAATEAEAIGSDPTANLLLTGAAGIAALSLGADAAFRGVATLGRELTQRAGRSAAIAGVGLALDAVSDDPTMEALSKATLAAALMRTVGSARLGRQASAVARTVVDKLSVLPPVRRELEQWNPEWFLHEDVVAALDEADRLASKGRAQARRWGEELAKDPRLGRAVTEVLREVSVKGYVSETLPTLSKDEMRAAMAIAGRLSADIDALTQAQVQAGSLTPEQAAASGGGAYLPFLYASTEAASTIASMRTGRTPGAGGATRQTTVRSRSLDVPVQEAERSLALAQASGDLAATLKAQQRLDDAIATRNAARESMGEIRDASYLASYALERGYANAAAATVQRIVWGIDGAVLPEYKLASEELHQAKALYAQAQTDADRLAASQLMADARETMDHLNRQYQRPDGDFVALPNSPTYGVMAGAVVSRPLYLAMGGMEAMTKADPLVKAWKQLKTVFNPGTHLGNVMGNLWMAHMSAGIPVWQQLALLPAAGRSLKAYDADAQRLAEAGVLGTNASVTGTVDAATKRRGGAREKDLLALRRQTDPKTAAALKAAGVLTAGERIGGRTGALVDRIAEAWRSDFVGGRKFVDDARRLYENEDNIFRVMAYQHAKRPIDQGGLGMADDAAVAFARTSMVDFSTRSPVLIRLSRGKVGIPFILYPAKALPRAMASIIDHPERYATLAAFWASLDAASELIQGGDIDELFDVPEEMRSTFQGPLSLLLPEVVQVPLPRDARGARPAMDMTRWTPLSSLTTAAMPGTGAEAIGLPGALQMGGPYLDLISKLTNARDPRTGRSFARYEDTKLQNAGRFAAEAAKTMAPPVVGYHLPTFIDATRRGDPTGQAMAVGGMVGLRPRYYAPGEGILREKQRFDRAELEIQQDTRRRMRLGGDDDHIDRTALDAARRTIKAREKLERAIPARRP